nr:PREDICTED: inactive dual specificity phosphatase 27 [Latimeria chalumnae]|eukprot:XP_014351408.1 PREDICTED: inactive dual specificity phosphatase 27 [Latimeria chalumnae]
MATRRGPEEEEEEEEQVVPDENGERDVQLVQARYLRSPSPSRLVGVAAEGSLANHKKKRNRLLGPNSLFLFLQFLIFLCFFSSPTFCFPRSVAVNKARLKRMGISHVLNTAHGTGVYTGTEFYAAMDIQYLGIEADDFPNVDISKHFRKAAEFMDEALLTYKGKILVNSVMGISRSATLIAAYLMIFHHKTIMEALMTIRKRRPISPNEGFLKQLRDLNESLLEERGISYLENSDDDDETLSQSSAIEAKTYSIAGEEEDTGSIMGAKVHSIMVEEEDDMTSVMGSVMSSAAKASEASKQPTLIDEDEEEMLYNEWRQRQGLPPKEPQTDKEEGKLPKFPEKGEEDVKKMVRDWQCKNEKYQSEEWWHSKFMNDDEDGDSRMGRRRCSPSELSELESVSSLDIRILKEQLEASGINKPGRGRSDSISTEDSTWDLWNQRLKDIEREALARCKSDYDDDDDGSMASLENEGRKKDVDEESTFSDTSSFFNFCKKNKEKLTPLERWKIKRIQFGWNKKNSEAQEGKKPEGESKEGEGEEKSKLDVDLTAYQNWRLKRQKKLGNNSKDEFAELVKGEDAASSRRKQRRAELLERSKQTLEESQSLCGWETESAMSGSIPLSTFLPNMSARSATDDTASMLSMQSNRSSLSQARSNSGLPQTPLPNLLVGPDDTVSLASIQNWIANVVTETIAQKQNEMMLQAQPPSAISDSSRTSNLLRGTEDDKISLLSMQSDMSYGSSLLRQTDARSTDTRSVMSCGSTSGLQSGAFGARDKVTGTSKPMYSLFVDDVDLKKLNRKEKEMKTEMRGKMFEYTKEKIASDNKRSTLFKKKKAKDDDEDSDFKEFTSGHAQYLNKSDTVSNISGCCANLGTVSTESFSDIDKWLSSVKSPARAPKLDGSEKTNLGYTDSSYQKGFESKTSDFRHSRSTAGELRSTSSSEVRENGFSTSSRQVLTATEAERKPSHRPKAAEMTGTREESTEPYFFSRTPDSTSNGESESPKPTNSRLRSPHHPAEKEASEDQAVSDLGPKRKFASSFRERRGNDEATTLSNNDEDEDGTAHRSYRRRPRANNETEGMDDDKLIAAWRSGKEEMRAKLQRLRKEL